MQPTAPDNPNRLHHHHRPGFGQNTKDWTIELVCVYFSKFSLFSFFGLEPLVFPLHRQFIYVHYFRLPDFYSPLGVSPETREFKSTMRFGRPSHYTALRLLRCSPSALWSIQYTHYTYDIPYHLCDGASRCTHILDCFDYNTRLRRL